MESLDQYYMARAIELAHKGVGAVSPNPMVGAVIVNSLNKIIGEGYHQKCGEAHAEVNAINDVMLHHPMNYHELLADSTIYVTLEPCSHFGKTPPCADKIIEVGIPRVVVGCLDPFEQVSGRGVEKLRNAGVDVRVGVLELECRELNCRFITAQLKKRPYVILKWAQSKDGYMDILRDETERPAWFTGAEEKRMVHRMRSEEDAIIVGRRTVELDNPSLTVREVLGRNPLRVVLDREGVLDEQKYKVFNNEAATLVYTENVDKQYSNAKSKVLSYTRNIIPQILEDLYSRGVQSLIVEGGAMLLNAFLELKIWDEAFVFTSNDNIVNYYPNVCSENECQGVKSPDILSVIKKFDQREIDIKTEYHPRLEEQRQCQISTLNHYMCREWE